jgi:hypothetical protein
MCFDLNLLIIFSKKIAVLSFPAKSTQTISLKHRNDEYFWAQMLLLTINPESPQIYILDRPIEIG